MPPSRPNETWSAVITPWAAKLNYTNQLASIKVADILSGNTCTPLSLSDFEGYLTFREHTVENLQFVVWYLDYRRRFFESTNPHGHDRDANDFQFYVPNRVSIERRAAESCADSAPTRGSIPDLEKRSLEKNQLQSNDKLQTDNDAPPEPAKIPPLPHSVDAPSMPTVQAELLFREECMRIVATFLRPESSKELSLDATVRETIIRDLRTSTHPDVFVHAYREAYDMLETVSLHRFITHATINVNWQKQLYHYSVGFTLYCISIIVAISLIMTVHVTPQRNRAWRLFAIPWFFCGCTTSYSSFRGFCSEVGGRGNLQLRAWELEENLDDEAMIFTDPKPHNRSQSTHSHQSACKTGHEARAAEDVFPAGLSSPDLAEAPSSYAITTTNMNVKAAVIAPFAEPFDDGSPHAPFGNEPQASRALTRPKVFGPERIVEDPRVKAVHQRLLWEIYVVALFGSLLYGAIIFSVPSGHAR